MAGGLSRFEARNAERTFNVNWLFAVIGDGSLNG
jgi:hypothetical protein